MASNGASPAARSEDVAGAMLEPSAFNKNWVRCLHPCSHAPHHDAPHDGILAPHTRTALLMCPEVYSLIHRCAWAC
jgi:hypothetical protein